MEFLGLDLGYTLRYWKRVLGIKKVNENPPVKPMPVENPKPVEVKKIEENPTTATPESTDIFKVFNPSEIVTDEEFTNCDSMNEKQIQDFLVSKGGVILTDLKIEGHLVSYWLNKHCKDLGLNPIIMLTHLQKEMGAITRKSPYKKKHSYDYIMGVGAYDGKWSEKWKGVDKQILGAAQTNMKWYSRGKEENTYPYNLKAGDRKDLMINNSATYSLYKYTPWVGDADKKIKTNKGYHVYKKPFGCYLFWKIYKNYRKYSN